MLKIVPTSMKNQRPTSDWRSCSRARRALAGRKRRTDSSCCPKVLASRMPLTDSVSSVMAETSASDFCVSVAGRAADLADPVGQVQEEGQDDERDGRQPPVEQDHGRAGW